MSALRCPSVSSPRTGNRLHNKRFYSGAADSRQLRTRVSFLTLNRHLSVPPALCTRRHRRLATLTCVFGAADVYEGHAPGSACVLYKNTSAPITTDASGQAEGDRSV